MADIVFYKNFPINSYEHQYYTNGMTTTSRNKEFDKYENTRFENISPTDYTKGIVRVPLTYRQANDFNYGYILSNESNGKRYYFFVINVEWVSNTKMAVVHFEIDYFQTYFSDFTFKKSYVDRMHCSDEWYNWVIEENLPVGEYVNVSNDVLSCDYFRQCLQVSGGDAFKNHGDNSNKALPSIFEYGNRNVQPLTIIDNPGVDSARLTDVLNELIKEGKSESVIGMYLQPLFDNEITIRGAEFIKNPSIEPYYISKAKDDITMKSKTINRPSKIGNFTPRNKKTLTYPYVFCTISNNNGTSVVGKFEYSDNHSSLQFDYGFPVGFGLSQFGYFRNYSGQKKNWECSLVGLPYPQIGYAQNVYDAYIGANFNSISTQQEIINQNEKFNVAKNNMNALAGYINSSVGTVNGVASGLSSGTTGVLVGAGQSIMSGIVGTANNLANWGIARAENKMKSNQSRALIDATLSDLSNRGNIPKGSFVGYPTLWEHQFGFKVSVKTVVEPIARLVDDYYTMYGYKLCRIYDVGYAMACRSNFNHVEIPDLQVIGNCPQIAIDTVKQMFKNVTFWHDLSSMYNYEVNNKQVL